MLWPLFFLVTAIHAELCHPDAENAFKVRLSIRSALGEKAYVWDTDEEYLFRAMVAFSMRKVPNRESTEMNRNRINSAFFLDDHTLEFLKIPSTLAPPTDPSVPVWIIVFGVIFCIVIVAIALLVLSGIRQRQRKNKGPPGVDDVEDKCENIITIENGIPCDPLDTKEGHVNDGFSTEDERLTPL